MAKQRASVLLIVLGLAIVIFLLYRRYNTQKEGFNTAPIVPRVMSSPGYITTIAGTGAANYTGDGGVATNAGLNAPTGIIIDSANNVIIADTNNNRVRMVSGTTGIITTIAGGGNSVAPNNVLATSATISPYGLGYDSSGNLYIADSANSKIYVVIGPGITTSPYVAGTTVKPGFIYTIVGGGQGFSGDGGPAINAKLFYCL